MRSPLFILILTAIAAAAQTTPPTAETTFTAASGSWGTAGNWDNGIPTTTATNAALDDALIGDGNTVSASNTNGNTFGTLTLGVGSRINLSASNNSGLASSANVYLKEGSTFHWASGHSRTSGWPNYRLVAHNSHRQPSASVEAPPSSREISTAAII